MASQEAESNTQQELWPYTLPPLMPSSYPLQYSWAFLVAQLVKNLPAIRETWVRSLGWEDPLEKGKATHSSILVQYPWGRKE